VLAIQGADDEYGTLAQIQAIEREASGPVETLVLPGCGHSPHRTHQAATLAAIARFVHEL
jgi:pimeloyl-ACP methyl ester carboxylesterase